MRPKRKTMPTEFRELDPQAFPLVNRFYKQNAHKGKAKGGERVFTLYNNGTIQAALRALPMADGYLLRSVWVAVAERNKGLGTILLKQVTCQLSRTSCWCYPYPHLDLFYQQAGFKKAGIDTVPEVIADLYLSYAVKQPGLLLMIAQPQS